MRSKLDLSERVPNKDRRFGAALEYYPAQIVTGFLRRPALFTPAQISEAMRRAMPAAPFAGRAGSGARCAA